MKKESASVAKWISYPGDFEILLMNRISTRRFEHDAILPPFWRMDTVYPLVKFYKSIDITKSQEMRVWGCGQFNVDLHALGKPVTEFDGSVILNPGHYDIIITVFNECGLPSIFVEAEDFVSDESWEVSCNDHRFFPACIPGDFNCPEYSPNDYRLETEPKPYVSMEPTEEGILYDFGKEIMSFIRFFGVKGNGRIQLYYGESREEALDKINAVLTDQIVCNGDDVYTTPLAKGFRYVQIITEDCSYAKMEGLIEFLPLSQRGSFTCSDELINKIWEVSRYTLQLNTRELFLDGIKRDRWVWGGDAYQSYLMDYYTFFDKDVIKRTMLALRGKEPTLTHINHIMDYSFYWLMGFYEYYLYTGDLDFIRNNYEKFDNLLHFCINRTNKDGFMHNLENDWVFVDWADINNIGEVCFEQILYAISLGYGAEIADILGYKEDAEKYCSMRKNLLKKIEEVFFDRSSQAYVYSRKEGELDGIINKYPNMFAILYGLADESTKKHLAKEVLKNPSIAAITTPYMRFYELSAICEAGDSTYVLDEIRNYWGAMLERGATTFWEAFDPEVRGVKQYEMYGNAFGKSLCHAWSASPVYIFGRYILGVRPLKPGYELFEARPRLSGLEWIQGVVPTNEGEVRIHMEPGKLDIFSTHKNGILVLDKEYKLTSQQKPLRETDGGLEYEIEAGKQYVFYF